MEITTNNTTDPKQLIFTNTLVPSEIISGNTKVEATNGSEIVMKTNNVERMKLDNNQISISNHILPTTDNTYDIGSPDYKIRDIYISDNSLWIGDKHKISISNDKIKFRKRKTTMPSVIQTVHDNATTEQQNCCKNSSKYNRY